MKGLKVLRKLFVIVVGVLISSSFVHATGFGDGEGVPPAQPTHRQVWQRDRLQAADQKLRDKFEEERRKKDVEYDRRKAEDNKSG